MAKFQPGRSGNPGGRPKTITEVRDLARAKTAEAIEALAQIATAGESEAARVSAAVALLDRAWGKAPQAIAGPDGEGPVAVVSRIERVIVRPNQKPEDADG
ncbi:hypothetical protein RHODGE_RHODGE_03989 [Rhodoplanes serenus]|uniref:DUF5681 domain-containing protein n=1 Tax=Rhodoplanes serenus TaxID=200615 RepID=A0A447CZY2_9BRAD|nr:DUF5681 domain-containing protein [Rhodoplanes serenus]VCU10785.1 hypothetical protein RHODGE_RHODGE_03989 [Rhodoplanes serenus]